MNSVRKFFNKNNWLLDILPMIQSYNDIVLAFQKHIKKNAMREITKLKRETMKSILYLNKNANKLLEEERFLHYLHGYIKYEGFFITKREFRIEREMVKEAFNKKGYFTSSFFDLSPIRSENLFFKKSQDIIRYMINEEGIKIIKIDNAFISKLNEMFNANIGNTRSFNSVLERQTFLRKISSSIFVSRKENEKEIAKEMKLKLDKIDFVFLDKVMLNKFLKDILEKHELLHDEYYYILKDYYPNAFFYSTGNSMYISRDKKLANLSHDERILKFTQERPFILTRTEISLQLGLNEFAIVNSKYVKPLSGDFLLLNKANNNHFNYLKKIFNPFLEKKKKVQFETPEIRKYLSEKSSEFEKRLSKMKSYKNMLIFLYGDDISYFSKSNKLGYKIDVTKYIDVDDWDSFS